MAKRKQGKATETRKIVAAKEEPAKGLMGNIVIATVILAVIGFSIPLYLNGKKADEIKAGKIMSDAAALAGAAVTADAKPALPVYFRPQNPNTGKIQQLYQSILADYKSTKAVPEAMLGLADAYCDNNQFTEAWENYNNFIEKFPRHALLPEAIVGRGDVVYRQGKYAMAQAEWDKVLKTYNGGKNKYCVELKLADCYLKLGNKEAAKALCEEVIRDSKEGSWADIAKGLLKTIK